MGNQGLSATAKAAKAGLGSTLGATQGKAALAQSSKLTAKARRAGKSPNKKEGREEKDNQESGLASPTSISMQNSFIIKNADESFDAYFH